MTLCRSVALAALFAAGTWIPLAATADEPTITRTDLQQEDLSIPDWEVIQVLVEFAPGASFPRHSHPGEEFIYVTEGSIEYQIDGQPPVIVNAGEVLSIPYGAVHAARNVGTIPAAELATYIVEKGQPLLEIAE